MYRLIKNMHVKEVLYMDMFGKKDIKIVRIFFLFLQRIESKQFVYVHKNTRTHTVSTNNCVT